MVSEDEDSRLYTVVINREEQYSIWLAGIPLPEGWSALAKIGTKAECLAHIGLVWKDMRPLSLRNWLAEQARGVSAGA